MKFKSLSQRPRHFRCFTGLTVDEFNKFKESIEQDWHEERQRKLKKKRKRKIGGGRKLKLPNLEDRMLVFSIYAGIYTSYLMPEYLFGIDESNVCRIIKELTPILSKKIVINRHGKKITSLEELREIFPDLDEVLFDATEQKIPGPKKKKVRKKYHSGKKKSFTIKTQLLTDNKGLILHASDSSPGRTHDYQRFKQSGVPEWPENNPDITAYGDLGYIGAEKDYPKASFKLPHKRNRWKKELTRSEKIMNTKQRKKRIPVEHALSRIKKFKILSDTYRNAKEHYSAIFKSICFMSNLRMLERMPG